MADHLDVEFIAETFDSTGSEPRSGAPGGGMGSKPAIEPLVHGERSTFGSEPWWSEKNWWKLSNNGEGNDVRAHLGGAGKVAVAAVSIRGNRHRLQGLANQDTFALTTVTVDDGRGFIVAVVCDGMGSAKYSGFGSRAFAYHTMVALATTVESYPDSYEDVLVENQAGTLRYISNRVIDYRQDEFEAPDLPFGQINIEDLQCTMSFAIVPAQPSNKDSNSYSILTGVIGDSPIFLLRDGDWQSVEEVRQQDTVWNSGTSGALGADSMSIGRLTVGESEAVLLATDGVGNFLHFQGQSTSLGKDLAHRWERPVGMHEFIRDTAFELQSADDDRTSIMMWFDRR
jgi:hypothetical protein